jgi:4,5:9,10-diseco-3-hydroxy-5,9,17-trioxoandrosta-1(10),2-diene-4-oate hydrolase
MMTTETAPTPASNAASTLRAEAGVQPPFEIFHADGTPVAVKRVSPTVAPPVAPSVAPPAAPILRRPAVVCLHATGHGGRDYEGFAATLAANGFEAITVDWPGQGASPPEATAKSATGKTASAGRYADLLEDLLPRLHLAESPILVGNSIGGAAALIFALRHPERVRALVLCNPGGLAPVNAAAKAVIAMMVAFFAAGERGAGWFPRAFAAYYRSILPEKAAHEQRARIVRGCLETAPVLRQSWESFRKPEADLRAAAEGLRVPVLFAWAKKDRVVAWSRSRKAVKAIPGAEVQLFNGGHAAFLEDPDAFNESFFSFVKRHHP